MRARTTRSAGTYGNDDNDEVRETDDGDEDE